jgi:hypothetical protein
MSWLGSHQRTWTWSWRLYDTLTILQHSEAFVGNTLGAGIEVAIAHVTSLGFVLAERAATTALYTDLQSV